ncbi:MAG TPA: hypothetical protein VF318_03005 [Dehalococcoidales bacterium]
MVWTGCFHQFVGDAIGQDTAGVRIAGKMLNLYRNLSVGPAVCRFLVLVNA